MVAIHIRVPVELREEIAALAADRGELFSYTAQTLLRSALFDARATMVPKSLLPQSPYPLSSAQILDLRIALEAFHEALRRLQTAPRVACEAA